MVVVTNGCGRSNLSAAVSRLLVFVIILFFVSSRRRHTRCSRDWSSDVCSSDLRGTRFKRATFPSLVKEGWPSLQENGPIPLMGADGVVGSTSNYRWVDQHHPVCAG